MIRLFVCFFCSSFTLKATLSPRSWQRHHYSRQCLTRRTLHFVSRFFPVFSFYPPPVKHHQPQPPHRRTLLIFHAAVWRKPLEDVVQVLRSCVGNEWLSEQLKNSWNKFRVVVCVSLLDVLSCLFNDLLCYFHFIRFSLRPHWLQTVMDWRCHTGMTGCFTFAASLCSDMSLRYSDELPRWI